MKAILTSLVSGAFAVTTAEYFFKYNLLDLIKDKLQGLITHTGLKVGDTAGAVLVLALFVGIIVLLARI